MVENPQSQEIYDPSVREVEKFITRMWKHPLLTEQTKAYRQASLRAMQKNLEYYEINRSDVIAIPCGSVVWITNKSSDFDYKLIDLTNSLPEEHKVKTSPVDSKIQVFEIVPGDQLALMGLDAAFNLLLTPDDYLLGNKQAAAQIRLATIDNLCKEEVLLGRDQEENNSLNIYFSFQFKYWNADKGKRQERYKNALRRRVDQSYGGRVWKNKFEDALYDFRVPPLTSFQDALIKTQGRLRVNPQYAAQGIAD